MAAEPAGPVSAPPSPMQRESFLMGADPEPAGSPAVGVTLGYPSGQAGLIELVTQVRGQRMLSSPDIETSTSFVLSGSGVPGRDAGVVTPAAAGGERPSPAAGRRSQSLQPHATAAAGDLTILISTTWM